MTEDQELHKQYAFEDYMKTVLRNKARNIHKKLIFRSSGKPQHQTLTRAFLTA